MNLRIVRGDTRVIPVYVEAPDGGPQDLTGYIMTMTAKKDINDADIDAIFQKTGVITDPATGVGVITLNQNDTNQDPAEYVYDIQINKGTDDIQTVVLPHALTIIADVTRNVPT